VIDETTLGILPESSGVYIFRDGGDRIIYIGKAKSIRDRVRSYFSEGGKDPKTARLARQVDRVEVVLTESEKEAFLLENNLIKEHTPKYNINLKDDKTYVSLKLSFQHPFPGLYVTREIKDDGALYFGPYPHARAMRDVLTMVQGLYPIRRCKDSVFKKRKRPCMLFEIGKCIGPCSGQVDKAAYGAVVEEMVNFLSGKDEKVLKDLERRISEAAGAWNFEEAGVLKERYLAIKGMTEKQRVHEHLGKNRDVWAFSAVGETMSAALLTFRKGILISKRQFRETGAAMPFQEALSSFLFQYYLTRPIPDEVILSEDIADLSHLEKYLKERKNGPVRIYGPGSRLSKDMAGLAVENLLRPEAVELDEAFKTGLHLKRQPVRIEAYDISHTHGKNPSGVMVVFQNFKATKSEYRVFHIRGPATMDDVAMMSEVLRRRLSDEKIRPLPDLLVIDGGKGHLSAAVKALKDSNIATDAISIAKDQRRKNMEDLIYLPMRKNPLPIPKASPVFKEIVRIRDEAHRFAVSSHKKWKRKEDLSTAPGTRKT
jgi:excinuclease ABC subunit C